VTAWCTFACVFTNVDFDEGELIRVNEVLKLGALVVMEVAVDRQALCRLEAEMVGEVLATIVGCGRCKNSIVLTSARRSSSI